MPEADRILEMFWYKSDTWVELKPRKGKGLVQGHIATQKFIPRLTASFAFWQIYRQCQAQRHHYNGRGWWLTPLWDETVSGEGWGPQEAPSSLFSLVALYSRMTHFFLFTGLNIPLPPNLGLVLYQNTLTSSWFNDFFRLTIFRASSLCTCCDTIHRESIH